MGPLQPSHLMALSPRLPYIHLVLLGNRANSGAACARLVSATLRVQEVQLQFYRTDVTKYSHTSSLFLLSGRVSVCEPWPPLPIQTSIQNGQPSPNSQPSPASSLLATHQPLPINQTLTIKSEKLDMKLGQLYALLVKFTHRMPSQQISPVQCQARTAFPFTPSERSVFHRFHRYRCHCLFGLTNPEKMKTQHTISLDQHLEPFRYTLHTGTS